MDNNKKIVIFKGYCQKCIHKNVYECDEPCNECLTNTVNENSERPVNYVEDKNK